MPEEIKFADQPLIIRRQNLKNKNFTILSSNELAGVIYRDLGLEPQTPTVDLAFTANGFIDFLEHLRFYIGKASLTEETNSGENFPVGVLGDSHREIRIKFKGYPDFATAQQQWESRKKLINYDNLYIMMTDRDGATYETIKRFNRLPFEHKVMLTGKNYPEFDNAYWIHNCVEDGHLGDWQARPDEFSSPQYAQFNYVDFLNQTK